MPEQQPGADTMRPSPAAAAFHVPLATWIWLIDLDPQSQALVITDDDGTLAGEVAPHVASVHQTRRLPFSYEAGSFALVVLASPFSECVAALGTTAGSLLSECRRVLGPGGWLVTKDYNPWWGGWPSGEPRRARRLAALGLASRLRTAGFPLVRSYYEYPSLHTVSSIVPATRAAARAHENFIGRRGTIGMVRRALVACGCHWVLYRARLLLARV